jgi:RNA-directed DNA polymerase
MLASICVGMYYAVRGNNRSLHEYFYAASRVLFKWLNRRSQRRRFSWQRFGPVLRDCLPPIRIRHQLYPAYGE